MADAVREQIRDFILENYLFTKDTSAIGYDDSLLDKGVVDSTGMLEIVMFLEERFAVVPEDREMVPDNLDSINKIARFVATKRQSA